MAITFDMETETPPNTHLVAKNFLFLVTKLSFKVDLTDNQSCQIKY